MVQGKGRTQSSFLTRLARDTRGNTMAIMAAALFPMCAMTGSAIDAARMYVVKVRLQQACDAGVLAGRKFMDEDSNTSTLDVIAANRAREFFGNNFKAGWFNTSSVQFTPVKSADNQVSATASVSVPMTTMRMFGMQAKTLSVACEARFDVADVDTMLVLDTTGSMICAASEASCTMTETTYVRPDGTTGYTYVEKSSSKIVALRNAVLAFYDALANNADPSTNIRYGIVPYTSTVNAGFAIRAANPAWMVSDNWAYQSRRVIGDTNSGGATLKTYTNTKQSDCNSYAGRTPASGYDPSTGKAVVTTVNSWTANLTGDTSKGTCIVRTQAVVPTWRYEQVSHDISDFVKGDLVADPTKINGATTRWQGCIEERDTDVATSFDYGDPPADLDADLPATSRATRWRPMWPEVEYNRGQVASKDTSNEQTNLGSADQLKAGYVSCGKPVQRLQEMTRAQLSAYVNAVDFKAIGGTYHDTGMIWGTRLLSPSGPFANDTAAHPGRQAPNRHIIFMTDGVMSPNQDLYGMYGIEDLDRRVTGGNFTNYTARHNARFNTECEIAKRRNITVWVVAFGSTLTDELRDCASTPARAFFVGTNAELEARFREIATQIAMLRVSQ